MFRSMDCVDVNPRFINSKTIDVSVTYIHDARDLNMINFLKVK